MNVVRRALGAALAGTLAATSVASAAPERALHVGLVQQPNSLDPLHAISYFENYLDEAIFSALTVIDDRGAVSADLAEHVPTRANGGISADGKTIVYRLRRGVRWQDGVPLTSHDVAFTFALMRDPKSNFPETSVYSIVDRLDTPDDRTVVLHLHSAWADATSQLFVGGQNGSIVPEHVLRGVADLTTSRFESVPVGSGPYSVERWDRGSRLVLRANPSYFRGRPAIDRIDVEFVPDQTTIVLRILTGELDFSPQFPQSGAAQLAASSSVRRTAVPTYNCVQLGFNTTMPPFDDARVRRALVMAIDRERLVSAVYHGFAVAADDLVPPQSPVHTRDPSVRLGGDSTGAAALLDRAGWLRGADGTRRKDGKPLHVVVTVPSGYVAVVGSAVQLQAAWHAIGVDAELKTVPSNVMLAPGIGLLPKGDFVAYLTQYGYETSADRADVMTQSGMPPAGRNYPRYDDRDVDAWTAQARTTLADAPRNALYAKISRRVRADAPLTPLLWWKQVYAYTPNLTGVRPETVNSDFWNVYDWRLK